ncbi:hypothetical protein FF38_06271 [Lucilia cuprina]|uniref:Uncharacterized protein n=1 Tax=Lucilia cuprina TaxID=7375 RepID=A0A0L0C6P9_LUCCU|nr:hypothetical protein FF38_06271 [Lucilia cuprina]
MYNIDTTACLFNTMLAIFYSFHLLYEDFQLDDIMHAHLLPLAKIDITQSPGTSDHKQLFTLCTRTMTLPLRRGATVEMQQIEFPANMRLWPTFHNYVAAGLKI